MTQKARARRPWLLPLVPLYRFAVWLKNRLYDLNLLRSKRLARPVVSVGSLSAGGAGKTPVVIALARLAAQHHLRVDVLTRGFGRQSRGTLQVQSNLPDASLLFGDEAVEISESAQVFVSAHRYDAGLLAEATGTPDLHLLDDGFQHRRLARTLDIVLLTQQDVTDTLLPAGNLREPLSSLKRAHVVVLREEEADTLKGVVADNTAAPIWIIRRALDIAEDFTRPFVFCAIARPESFLAMIRSHGFQPCGVQFFPDHHFFTEDQVRSLTSLARKAGADSYFCTIKDFVKLSMASIAMLEDLAPVVPVVLSVTFLDETLVAKTFTDILNA